MFNYEDEELFEELLEVPEVAKILKIGPNLVYELIHSGKLKSLKLGRMKVRRHTLNEFIRNLEEEYNSEDSNRDNN